MMSCEYCGGKHQIAQCSLRQKYYDEQGNLKPEFYRQGAIYHNMPPLTDSPQHLPDDSQKKKLEAQLFGYQETEYGPSRDPLSSIKFTDGATGVHQTGSPALGSSYLTESQRLHLHHIQTAFTEAVGIKYRKGAAEHGGDLQDMSLLDLIENGLEEAIDSFVFLQTAKDKLKQILGSKK